VDRNSGRLRKGLPRYFNLRTATAWQILTLKLGEKLDINFLFGGKLRDIFYFMTF
jgi:hypothetical protein